MNVVVRRLKLTGVTAHTPLRLQTTGVTIALNRLLVTIVRMYRVTCFVQTALAVTGDTGRDCCSCSGFRCLKLLFNDNSC